MSDSRVVLIDDHQLFRDGLRTVLGLQEGLAVVGEAAGVRDGREVVAQTAPDVAVVDLTLNDAGGIALTQEIARGPQRTHVLILTMHDRTDYVADALAAGALGYALKDQPTKEVIAAIRAVARGEPYLAPRIAGIAHEPRGGVAEADALESLSAREREIFDLVVHGSSNANVAHLLSISIKTVQTHRAWINRKLGAHSTADLVRIAAARGLLQRSQRG